MKEINLKTVHETKKKKNRKLDNTTIQLFFFFFFFTFLHERQDRTREQETTITTRSRQHITHPRDHKIHHWPGLHSAPARTPWTKDPETPDPPEDDKPEAPGPPVPQLASDYKPGTRRNNPRLTLM